MTQSGKVILQSDRLVFSTWAPDQIDDLVALHGNEEVGRYLMGRAEDKADAQMRLDEWADLYKRFGWCKFRLTRKSDGAFIGRAGFGIHPPHDTPELGYAILRSEWGNGYASEAARALRDWIFRETDHDYFLGYAYSANIGSIKILRAIGMEFTHTEIEEKTQQEMTFHKFTREMWHG